MQTFSVSRWISGSSDLVFQVHPWLCWETPGSGPSQGSGFISMMISSARPKGSCEADLWLLAPVPRKTSWEHTGNFFFSRFWSTGQRISEIGNRLHTVNDNIWQKIWHPSGDNSLAPHFHTLWLPGHSSLHCAQCYFSVTVLVALSKWHRYLHQFRGTIKVFPSSQPVA